MRDRELLKMAALASGRGVPTRNTQWFWIDDQGIHKDVSLGGDGTRVETWNPFVNQADAFDLQAQLHMNVYITTVQCGAEIVGADDDPYIMSRETHGGDVKAALMRAITRAAAEVGKHKKAGRL